MKRVTEPELMLDKEQAQAYALADFSESDDAFVARFIELFGVDHRGDLLDLGCGPGNIALRLAQAVPECRILGIEGAANMLNIARQRAEAMQLCADRLMFRELTLPSEELPRKFACGVVSNSLLHHLHNPEVLWDTIKRCGETGAPVLVCDLRRPESRSEAERIVELYARNASAILQEDFFNSLLAAFTKEEVIDQLERTGLNEFLVREVSDRYLEIQGFCL